MHFKKRQQRLATRQVQLQGNTEVWTRLVENQVSHLWEKGNADEPWIKRQALCPFQSDSDYR